MAKNLGLAKFGLDFVVDFTFACEMDFDCVSGFEVWDFGFFVLAGFGDFVVDFAVGFVICSLLFRFATLRECTLKRVSTI